ncbi:hypothetical protein LUCX_110 [Xanthomonas phage vB_XciM_LucasX]|nr:hypothetical protein LUCX_110 [Xanthomonas phage vB_XciM_LucasX]
MKKLKQKFLATLESFDEGADTAIDHTATPVPVEDLTHQIELAKLDVESLVSLKEAISENTEVGLEAMSAKMAHIQLTAIQRRHGLQDDLPSVQDFHGRGARLATAVSLESVSNTIEHVQGWIARASGATETI